MKADDPRHGTANGYNNLGCRCERCRAAWRVRMNEYHHRTGRHKPKEIYLAELRAKKPPPHGTESRYTRRGCRCDECRRAGTAARRRRRSAA